MSKSILKQLFDGDLAICEHLNVSTPEHKEVAHRICDTKEEFIKSLSETDKLIFDKIESLNCEYTSILDYEYFAQGVKISVNLILEALGYKKVE